MQQSRESQIDFAQNLSWNGRVGCSNGSRKPDHAGPDAGRGNSVSDTLDEFSYGEVLMASELHE